MKVWIIEELVGGYLVSYNGGVSNMQHKKYACSNWEDVLAVITTQHETEDTESAGDN